MHTNLQILKATKLWWSVTGTLMCTVFNTGRLFFLISSAASFWWKYGRKHVTVLHLWTYMEVSLVQTLHSWNYHLYSIFSWTLNSDDTVTAIKRLCGNAKCIKNELIRHFPQCLQFLLEHIIRTFFARLSSDFYTSTRFNLVVLMCSVW